jgi:hypothetical protein
MYTFAESSRVTATRPPPPRSRVEAFDIGPFAAAATNARDRHALSQRSVLALQRSAGNAAVARMLAKPPRPVVQRCGDIPAESCPCHAGDDEHAVQRQTELFEPFSGFGDPAVEGEQAAGPEAEAGPDAPATAPDPELTERRLIDQRIDVGAQRSLMRMFRGSQEQREIAVEIADAVQVTGELAGVFGDDLGASAQLASRLGTVRWELVPDGQDAVVVREPDRQPTMVFREGARSSPARIDPALQSAWDEHTGGGGPLTCELGDPEEALAATGETISAQGRAGSPAGAVCSPKKPKSVAVNGSCVPTKSITGTFLVPAADAGDAATMVADSKAALAGNGITLDMTVKPFAKLFDTDFGASVDTNDQLCGLMRALKPHITQGGVVILMVPINGTEICDGPAEGCYKAKFGLQCGGDVGVSKLIVLNSFTAKSSCPATIVAHEIGHAAGQPGHRDRSGTKGDYMGFTCPRDHFHPDDLSLVCGARLRF